MAQYRKKPVVIEAEQFHADKKPWPEGVIQCQPDPDKPKEFKMNTLEGPFKVSEGDWIITDVKGERYPIKDEVFQMTYEPVGDRVSESDGS